MNVEVQSKPKKMNTASASPIAKIQIVEASLPLSAAEQSRHENWRYHVAMVVTLAVFAAVAIYGSFAVLF